MRIPQQKFAPVCMENSGSGSCPHSFIFWPLLFQVPVPTWGSRRHTCKNFSPTVVSHHFFPRHNIVSSVFPKWFLHQIIIHNPWFLTLIILTETTKSTMLLVLQHQNWVLRVLMRTTCSLQCHLFVKLKRMPQIRRTNLSQLQTIPWVSVQG